MSQIFGGIVLLGMVASGATPEQQGPWCLIKTSKGDIFVRLFADEAPKTVENFLGLAEGTREFTDPVTKQKVKKPFYDNLTFHRVIKGFMIQGGCPLGTGTGSPGYVFEDEMNADALGLGKLKVVEGGSAHPWLGVRSQAEFARMVMEPLAKAMGFKDVNEVVQGHADEFNSRIDALTLTDAYTNLGYKYNMTLKSHAPKRGVLAMANAGPNTNGSQFFINLIDTPWLTGKHTVFGEVVKGMDIVDAIATVPVDAGAKPNQPVRILSIRSIKEMPKP